MELKTSKEFAVDMVKTINEYLAAADELKRTVIGMGYESLLTPDAKKESNWGRISVSTLFTPPPAHDPNLYSILDSNVRHHGIYMGEKPLKKRRLGMKDELTGLLKDLTSRWERPITAQELQDAYFEKYNEHIDKGDISTVLSRSEDFKPYSILGMGAQFRWWWAPIDWFEAEGVLTSDRSLKLLNHIEHEKSK